MYVSYKNNNNNNNNNMEVNIMSKQCTNFWQVINRMHEWNFDFIKDTQKNRKTCLLFEGSIKVNMQHLIGYKFHVEKIGMRGGLDVLQVTRV